MVMRIYDYLTIRNKANDLAVLVDRRFWSGQPTGWSLMQDGGMALYFDCGQRAELKNFPAGPVWRDLYVGTAAGDVNKVPRHD